LQHHSFFVFGSGVLDGWLIIGGAELLLEGDDEVVLFLVNFAERVVFLLDSQ
jgi:hypothetical protein